MDRNSLRGSFACWEKWSVERSESKRTIIGWERDGRYPRNVEILEKKTLFSIEEAAEKGTIICMLLSDAGQQSQSNAGGQQGGGDGQPEDVEFEEVK